VVETGPDRDERQIETLSASLHDAFDDKQPEVGAHEALEALMGIDPDSEEPDDDEAPGEADENGDDSSS
jgi:hypothetical protein